MLALTICAGSSALVHANPFAPPDVDPVRPEVTAPRDTTAAAPQLDQSTLERIYASDIVGHIIRRSHVISVHDGNRRLLYEPTMDCYLEQTGSNRLQQNDCLTLIRERMFIHQNGVPEYPVLDMSAPTQSTNAAQTSAGSNDRAVLADPDTMLFADATCDGAYQSMQSSLSAGDSIITFENATLALRGGYRRAPSSDC